MSERQAHCHRKTGETEIEVHLDLDGTGDAEVYSGIGFFDHMLQLLARHSCIDMKIAAKGDLHVDQHHTVEDVGICLGKAVQKALGDKAGIRRYGNCTLPMDECLCTVAIDLSGRYALRFSADFSAAKIGDFDTELIEEFCRAFASNAQCNLHILLHYGQNNHHISEVIFKGIARALRMAVELDGRTSGIPSTKGILSE